jgi:predicted Zn-dependent protease
MNSHHSTFAFKKIRLSAVLVLLAVGIQSAEPAAHIPAPVATALRAISQQEPTAALEILSRADSPDHQLIWCARGQILQRLGRMSEAESAYKRSIAFEPTLTAAHAGLAQIYALDARWQECVAACGLAYDPATADAAVLRFWISAANEAKDFTVASHLYGRAIPRFPHDNDLRRLELRSRLERPSHREETLSCAEALILRVPEDSSLWAIIAALRSELGDTSGALIALEAAYFLTQSADSAYRLAVVEMSQQRAFSAWKHLRPYVQDSKTPTHLLLVAARAVSETGDYATARELLNRIPEVGADGRQAKLERTRIAVRAGDFNTAWGDLDTLLNQGEHDPHILAWAGSIAEQRNDLPRAEACYRAAIAQKSDLTSIEMRLADLLHRTARTDEARTIISTALERHPGDPALLSLAAFLQ